MALFHHYSRQLQSFLASWSFQPLQFEDYYYLWLLLAAISSNNIKVVLIITKSSPPFSPLSLAEPEGQIYFQCYLFNSYYLVYVNLHVITWLLFSSLLKMTLKLLVKT